MENKDHAVESTKMVTAVEWLVENAEDFFGGLLAPSIIEQAKQMEKEQIITACACGTTIYSPDETRFKYAEQYYIESYQIKQK